MARFVTLPENRRRRLRVDCYIEGPLLRALDDICESTLTTRSSLLRQALVEHIDRRGGGGA